VDTQARAKAASSMMPTSSYRSRTSAITSSEISLRASAFASSTLVRGRTAS
jgi:hypothetical protein